MSRSLKKGPYTFGRLLKRVKALNETGKNEDMVGHKLGEFALTRKFNGHAGSAKK